jgi:hypothetical protein
MKERRENGCNLPYLFNAGEEWTVEAKKAVIADADTKTSWVDWMRFWNHSYVFHEDISYGEKLEELRKSEITGRQEWLERVGGGRCHGAGEEMEKGVV